ncbi:carotenoid ester lipase [Epithele typhae]|uniref:carotenoid ester lipase n=1 Tax=Epithele typhae TaxID=378194 RepID=UPI0020075AA9|nr:carotenoid ester lipase [Epithele typhae]KAH9926264.1 carotenoid ester lipase [Epithele typhae]
MWNRALLAFTLHVACSLAAPAATHHPKPPTMKLDDATVVGVSDGSTRSFLGIPFAEPPTGDLRFQLPKPLSGYTGTMNATSFGTQCINAFQLSGLGLFPPWATQAMKDYFQVFEVPNPSTFGEDCLNLNVIVPEHVKPGAKLPVVAYIFFSGFQFSGSYNVDGRIMVNKSVEIGEPVVWVSMNYRVGPYGFLPGKEIKEAGVGNLGLQDQRQALRWIQQYIHLFGGDPERVTILGLSAAGASTALHLVANGGNNENLFHGAWGESGALQHVLQIDDPINQKLYDNFVNATNCTGTPDTLQCLREVDGDALENLVGNSGTDFWALSADGTFVHDLPQLELIHGHVAENVAVVQGISEDEGTIAALPFVDGVNDTLIANFVRAVYPTVTDDQIQELLKLYPNDPALGAPYNTGDRFQLAPELKRAASITGDIDFDAPHRLISQVLSDKQPFWSYYYERNNVPGFGSTHGAEIPNMYGGGDMSDLLIHFANYFSPNGRSGDAPFWPRYTTAEPTMLVFTGNTTFAYKNDTYRSEQISFLNKLNTES